MEYTGDHTGVEDILISTGLDGSAAENSTLIWPFIRFGLSLIFVGSVLPEIAGSTTGYDGPHSFSRVITIYKHPINFSQKRALTLFGHLEFRVAL